MQPRLRRRAARVIPKTRAAALVPGAELLMQDGSPRGDSQTRAQGMSDDEERRRRERSRADKQGLICEAISLPR